MAEPPIKDVIFPVRAEPAEVLSRADSIELKPISEAIEIPALKVSNLAQKLSPRLAETFNAAHDGTPSENKPVQIDAALAAPVAEEDNQTLDKPDIFQDHTPGAQKARLEMDMSGAGGSITNTGMQSNDDDPESEEKKKEERTDMLIASVITAQSQRLMELQSEKFQAEQELQNLLDQQKQKRSLFSEEERKIYDDAFAKSYAAGGASMAIPVEEQEKVTTASMAAALEEGPSSGELALWEGEFDSSARTVQEIKLEKINNDIVREEAKIAANTLKDDPNLITEDAQPEPAIAMTTSAVAAVTAEEEKLEIGQTKAEIPAEPVTTADLVAALEPKTKISETTAKQAGQKSEDAADGAIKDQLRFDQLGMQQGLALALVFMAFFMGGEGIEDLDKMFAEIFGVEGGENAIKAKRAEIHEQGITTAREAADTIDFKSFDFEKASKIPVKDLLKTDGPTLLDPTLISRMEKDPEVRQYVQWTFEAAEREGLDGNLLANQFWQESKYNPNAVSPMGAGGIAQLMPDKQGDWGIETRQDFFDPKKSIDGGAKLMAHLTNKLGSQELAHVPYNGGERAIEFVEKRTGDTDVTLGEWMNFMHGERIRKGEGPENAWRNQTFEYVEKINSNYWSEDKRQAALAKMKELGITPKETAIAANDKGTKVADAVKNSEIDTSGLVQKVSALDQKLTPGFNEVATNTYVGPYKPEHMPAAAPGAKT